MNVRTIVCGLPLLALALGCPALGQAARPAALPADASDNGSDAQASDAATQVDVESARSQGEIIVVADRIKGQVDVPEKPIETLSEEDIAAYGATSVTDLLSALSPQTGSGRGRQGSGGMPVMLLNGQRISSFREMRNLPPEAIRKIEILPEEVALRYGYPPDSRVVNIVLKNHFSAKTIELEYGQPQAGGTGTNQQEISLFTVNGQKRLNLTGTRNHTTMLSEAERRIIQTQGSLPTVITDPDPAVARTLTPDSTSASLNATWATGLGPKGMDGGLAINGTVTRSTSLSLSGLNTVVLTAPGPGGASATRTFGDPLKRDNQTTTLQGGATLTKPFGRWTAAATLDATRAVSDTRIDRRADVLALVSAAAAGTLNINGPLPAVPSTGSDRSYSTNDSAGLLVTVMGPAFHLPAGDANLTLRGGFAYKRLDAQDTRSLAGGSLLSRGDASTGFNIGLPITSRRDNVGSALGDINLHFSAGYDHYSDLGSLIDWSAGISWGVSEKLNLQASWIVNEQAPDLTSLGGPQSLSFNVPVYDFSKGTTALVTVTSGGNPALLKERDRDLKLGLNWQVPGLKNSNLIVEYFRNDSDNVTASFPVLTPDIEAAFPGRVTRQACAPTDPATCVPDRLIALDRRPVTFTNEKASRLRWGFNLGGTIGKANPMMGAMMDGGAPGGRGGRPRGGLGGGPGGGEGGRGGPGMMMAMGQGGQGRWSISIYHTIQFQNRVLVTRGGPVLDLLEGDALTGGGVARHSVEMEGGMFYKGIGLRLSGTWTSPTMINGTGGSGSSDLRFGALAKFNLRMFMDLYQQKWLAKKSPILKNARLALKVDNLFDARQRVTDQTGAVPISYQPDVIDPTGRFFGIELRKQF